VFASNIDHTVPWAIANASYKREKKGNPGITEIIGEHRARDCRAAVTLTCIHLAA
jgi:hypothetical protein